MKPDRAIIRLAFPHPVYGTFTPIKVEYEYPLGPNDNDQDALDDGKRRAEEWVASRYPALDLGARLAVGQTVPDIQSRKTPEEDRISKLISDINSSDDVKVLESYKLMVRSNPQLQEAYDNRLKQLIDGK